MIYFLLILSTGSLFICASEKLTEVMKNRKYVLTYLIFLSDIPYVNIWPDNHFYYSLAIYQTLDYVYVLRRR